MASLRPVNSSTPVQSAGPGPGVGAGAGAGAESAAEAAARPALGAAAAMASDTQDRALDLMSREVAMRIGFRGNLGVDEKAGSFRQVLDLEAVALPHKPVKLSMVLSRTQKRFINGLFDHPLHTKLSLLDLWGFDFVFHLKALMATKGIKLPLKDLSEVLKKFCLVFGTGYLSRTIERQLELNPEAFPGIAFWDGDSQPSGQYLGITSRGWVVRLQELEKRLILLLKPFRKVLQEPIEYLETSLKVGRELLLHRDSRALFNDSNLEACFALFPEARRLNEGSPQASLERFEPICSICLAGLYRIADGGNGAPLCPLRFLWREARGNSQKSR